jgi:hypothetical protein
MRKITEVKATTTRDHLGAHFLMITADPDLANGDTGDALALVNYRLRGAKWPIYRNTRHRDRIRGGDWVAFYVGGQRASHGYVIGFAQVAEVVEWGRDRPRVDPSNALTDPVLAAPVRFRDALTRLSFCPPNLRKWGAVVMGGCRFLSFTDWCVLTGVAESIAQSD